MKKKLYGKKAISLLVAPILILSLAGCSSNNSPTASGNTEKSSGTSTQKPTGSASGESKDAEYQLDLWMYDTGKMTGYQAVEDALSKLAKEKINCSVKLHLLDGATYSDKLNLEVTSKSKMDLVNPAFGGKYLYYASTGVYTPLDDYLNGEYKNLYDLVGKVFTDGTKVNGKIYGLPVNKEKGQTNGYVFNKELVEKYNFDLTTIKTYKDIEPWLDIIAENEKDITPFTISNGGISNLLDLECEPIYYNGLVYIEKNTKDYTFKSPLEIESNKEIFRWVRSIYEKGYINKDLLTDESGSNSPARKYKFFAESMNLKPGFAGEKESQYGGPIVCVDLQKPYTPFSQSVGSMMGIPSTSTNPDKAMAFLNLLYTDSDVINTIVYGVDGVNIQKVDDKHAKLLDGESWSNFGWAYGNQFLNYIFENEPEDKYTQFEKFNAEVVPSKILGFAIDSEKTTDLYNACSSGPWKQYQRALYIGAIDPDEMIPKIQTELDAAGYQDLLKELQKELDEWVAKNK